MQMMFSSSPFLFFFLFFLSVTALNQEGLYLQRLKHSLSDPNGAFSSWSERDLSPCNWTGIACDGAGSVVSVSLSGANLAGPFPDFLCSLPSLSYLNLSNNFLNSSLPVSISKCRSLTLLELSENLLGGPIPPTIADLLYLRHLDLSNCYFSGEIPASFGRFRALEHLDLTENLLTGGIPAVLGNITSLKWIGLAFNPFAPSQLPSELGNLKNLEYLWLSGCHLVGPIPESIWKLSRLTNFDASNNQLTGSIPSTISQMKSVVQIELFNNSLTGELPAAEWSNMTALRRFDVSMNALTGTIPPELCELPLASLNLFNNRLEGLIPESIANSPNLREFKLYGNRLVGSIPSQLGANSALQLIDLSFNNLSGRIPERLCDKGGLNELILLNNSFSGRIPAILGRCRSLTRVRLCSNRLFGEIPAEIFTLPRVFLLDLKDNEFSGNISRTISAAKSLSNLQISRNKLSGSIPSEIGEVVTLVKFQASDNELEGEIPGTMVNLKQLATLDLSNNKLSGGIPKGIQSMKQLSDLNLANNGLSGEIPDEIGSLPVLNYLDLSRNFFSGKIPLSMENLKLNTFNLSYNQLSGEIPPFFEKGVYKDSFLGNPGLCDRANGLCSGKREGKHEGYFWLLRTIYVLAGIVFLVGIVCFIWKYKKFKKMNKGVALSKWTSFHKFGFSEFEILDCLDEAHVIGNGASGKVYKATLSNGETVAVKKLRERAKKDNEGYGDSEKDEFDIEVETLGRIRHKNIVKLWCCCDAGDCKLLVYEYMPNGSLGDLLHSCKGSSLDWSARFKIACDAAEGLSYLHHDCVPPIVHRDVKSNNILLNEHFGAKISDFGVAKIVQRTNKGCPESMSVIAGSYGYIAPEYAYTLHVNEKSDIYSFGVVMLELVTGKRPVDPEFGDKDLASWACLTVDKKGVDQVIDPKLDSSFKQHICKVLDIALLCISPNPVNRPSMRRVVKLLQESDGNFSPMTGKKDTKVSVENFPEMEQVMKV